MNKTLERSCWVLGGLLLPVLAAAAPIGLTLAESARSLDSADLRSGVVVDPSRTAVYLMSPEGGIDAVSTSSGRLIWSTREAALPLALHGQLLLAQGPPAEAAGVLPVVLLDRQSGEPRQRLLIDLLEGVWATVDAGLSTTFEAQAVVREGELYLGWYHTRRYAKGVAPQPGEDLGTELAGAYRLDLAAGRAEAADLSLLKVDLTLPAAAQRWADSGDLSTLPAPAGEILAATRWVGERLVLMRWNLLGEVLPEIDLFSGPYVQEIRSADRRHLVVAERAAPGDWEEYGWSVFSLETGERLGQIRNHQSHAWFFVHGSELIYVAQPFARRLGEELVNEPLSLRAVQLTSGVESWARPLRDRSYRGPFPP